MPELESYAPKPLPHYELNDLIRHLYLTKHQSGMLASTLNERSLVMQDFRITDLQNSAAILREKFFSNS